MRVKRGQNYPGLKLSGPQSTNVINEAEETAERLSARNEWALQVNEFFPDLPSILKVERCTEFPFTRFRRDLVLKLDQTDGWWEVDALVRQPPPSSAGGTSGPGAASGGSSSPAGGGPTPALHLVRTPSPKDDGADEYRPISTAPRRVRPHRRAPDDLIDYLEAFQKSVCETSLFRHTMSVFCAILEWMRRMTIMDQPRKAWLVVCSRCEAVSASFSYADQIVQDGCAAFERRVVERGGRRLTLLTFSAYPKPNWESWLFGRLIEDEQVAV